MGIDIPDTFFTGFGSDKHDYFDIMVFGNGAIVFLIITEGEIGDNDSVDTAFYTCTAELFEAELHDRI